MVAGTAGQARGRVGCGPLSRFSSLFEHDLFGKPLHTFPDCALALVEQLVDTTLELARLGLALAQSFLEIADRLGRTFRSEGDADEIVARPDYLGEEGAAFARDTKRELFPGQLVDIAEFDRRAVI